MERIEKQSMPALVLAADLFEIKRDNDKDSAQRAPFAFIRAIAHSKGRQGYIVGVTHAGVVMDEAWAALTPRIARITIRDVQSGQQVFHSQASLTQPGAAEGYEDQVFEFRVGKNVWEIRMGFIKDDKILFLEHAFDHFCIRDFADAGRISLCSELSAAHIQVAQRECRVGRKECAAGKRDPPPQHDLCKLKQSESDHRAIIDSVNEVIFETDRQGQLVFLNESWQKITDFAEQSLGASLFNMLAPAEQEGREFDAKDLNPRRRAAHACRCSQLTRRRVIGAVELAFLIMRQNDQKDPRILRDHHRC